MRLRNKKTGEIITLKDEGELALLKLIENSLPNGLSVWEEVKEPLIKDEKIRKTIRSWADANDIEPDETVLITKPTFDGRFLDVEYGMLNMSFIYDDESIANKGYTIAELCGEGKE